MTLLDRLARREELPMTPNESEIDAEIMALAIELAGLQAENTPLAERRAKLKLLKERIKEERAWRAAHDGPWWKKLWWDMRYGSDFV